MHQRGGGRRGYQEFPSKIFCLTVPKISVGESFTVAKISGIEKVWIREGGDDQDFPSNFFLSHSAEKFCWGTLRCIRKFRAAKNFMHQRGGGRRGYQEFPSKIFCLTVPKISVGESFTVAKISGIEKVWIREGGDDQDFPSNFFLSHSAEKFCWGTLRCIRKFRAAKNFMHQRGGGRRGYQEFPSKIFCLTVPKNSVGESFTVAKISGMEKVWIREGGGMIKIFRRIFFVSQCQKIS